MTDNTEIARLAALPTLDYDRERKAAAKRMGVTVNALDKAVKCARAMAKPATSQQGKALELPQPEPWHEPVNGSVLVAEMAAAIQHYVIMEPGAAEAVALWIIHAHALDAFGISPRLGITSPERGCGKTTALDVVAALVPRPLPTANATPASIFRTIEAYRPTLLIDEADTFLRKNDELRGILNSGHRKSTAYVTRLVGDDYESKSFSTWCPTAIAMIGKLPDTLADRSIQVRLRRRRLDEPIASFRAGKTPELDMLARKAARWAVDHAVALTNADPAMPEGVFNRQADNWAPLLAIADAAGGEWPERARRTALATIGSTDDQEPTVRVLLLADIRDIFDRLGSDRLSSEDLTRNLTGIEGRPWAEWSHGRPMSKHGLARVLKPFNIGPGNIKFPDKLTVPKQKAVLKGYRRDQFEDAWSRYLPPAKPPD